jgi:hypothetical protein
MAGARIDVVRGERFMTRLLSLRHRTARVRHGLRRPAEQLSHKVLKHGGVQGVHLLLVATLNPHQVRQLEDGEVMGERRGPQPCRTRQFACGALAAAQDAQDGPTVGIREGTVSLLPGFNTDLRLAQFAGPRSAGC